MLSLCLCVSAVNLSCSSKPTDPRSVIPADALVYLETADLGKAIGSVTESEAFARVSSKKPDLSAVSGMKMSVAVTGFETSEEPVTNENSVLNFQPRFVAVVETNAWSWQASSFVENKLGEFINEAYGGGVELTVTPKDDGKFYVWTAQDGRKAYALLQGSLIFFGNDESAIEKCQAVRRGEADSIAKNPKIAGGERLAFGYISPDGIAQAANIEGISLAMQASEDSEVKSFIARVLPEILRNSVNEITWTASPDGTDDFEITLNPEVARVLNETASATQGRDTAFGEFVPENYGSVTLYNLADPRLAWRSLLLTAQSRTDSVSGNLIAAFSNSLFEPYAIEDGEEFLSSVDGQMATVRLDAEGDDAVVIARVKDPAATRKAIAKEIVFAKPAEKIGDTDVWRSEDGDYAAAFVGNVAVLGDAQIVQKCLEARRSGLNAARSGRLRIFDVAYSSAVSIAKDEQTPGQLAAVLGEKKETAASQTIITATTVKPNGINRGVRSDFGTIGAIIAQFAPDSTE